MSVRHDDGTWHFGFVRSRRGNRIMVTYSTAPGFTYLRWLQPCTPPD